MIQITKTEPKKETKKTYPGVRLDKKLKKYIATYFRNDVKHVATCNTFDEAKAAMIGFKKG